MLLLQPFADPPLIHGDRGHVEAMNFWMNCHWLTLRYVLWVNQIYLLYILFYTLSNGNSLIQIDLYNVTLFMYLKLFLSSYLSFLRSDSILLSRTLMEILMGMRHCELLFGFVIVWHLNLFLIAVHLMIQLILSLLFHSLGYAFPAQYPLLRQESRIRCGFLIVLLFHENWSEKSLRIQLNNKW